MRLLYFLFLCSVPCVMIVVEPEKEQCFFEYLKKGQNFGVQYQVNSGGDFNIVVSVYDPSGKKIYSADKESYGVFSIKAEVDGKHTYCFDNKGLGGYTKRVVFTVHGIDYRDDSVVTTEDDKGKKLDENLEKEINSLNKRLRIIREEYEFTLGRFIQNKFLANKINSRVFWWSFGEISVIVGICVWQIYYLKRFFEVRRIV